VADLNGDGKPDIVIDQTVSVTDPTIQVGVLLNNGDGTFQTAVTYGAGGSSSGLVYTSVVVADVNGEGKPDIVVGNDPGSIGVLLGNGDGTFQSAQTYNSGTGSGTGEIAVADLNGDGKLDVVIISDYSPFSSVGVMLGNGDGTFVTAGTYNAGGGTFPGWSLWRT